MLNESSTVQELLAEIHVQKEKLIKEKKIKKTNPLPPITDGEKPFAPPNGWKWVRLGELLYLVAGVSYKKNQISKSGIRLLRGGNIQTPNILFADDDIFLPQDFWNEEQSVQEDDIIIVASTGSETVIGKPGFARKAIPNTLIGAFLRICRPYSPQVADYLRMIFYSTYYRDYIRTIAKGANINNIRQEYIYNFVIPLPPLSEQRRLVARIESLFAKLDAAREKVQSVLDSHETRKAALLHAAFAGKLTAKWREEQGESSHAWRIEKLENLCEKITCGKTPKNDISPQGEIPYLKVYNIVNDKIDFRSKPQYISRDVHETKLKSSILKPNDVIMNIVGPPLRKIAIIPDTYPEWNMNQAIVRFRPKEGLDYHFLYYALLNPETLDDVVQRTKGVVGQANISITQSRNLKIKVPPLPEQQEIIRILGRLLAREQRARQAAEETLAAIDRMKQSILARAFRGEL